MVDRWMRTLFKAKTIAVTVAAMAVTTLCVLMVLTFWHNETDQPSVTELQIPGLCGWAGNTIDAKAQLQSLKGHFVPFVIWDAEREARAVSQDKRAVLWDAAIKVTGKHLPVGRQEIGDCVSWGAKHAIEYLECVQIATGNKQTYRPVYAPYIYGTSRVFIGKNQLGCSSDGSLGSWAAACVKQYGILAADEKNVPSYSGPVASKWGCKPGPPDAFVTIAKQYPVQSVANVTTWQEVRDALVNGYPVTIASDVGFAMKGTVKSGKLWLRQTGTWNHQMCVIGYDTQPEPCFFILNSWGETAHGKQPDGPDGGFWVVAKVIQRIVSEGDSFAYSSFDGFKRQRWDVILQREGVMDALDIDAIGSTEWLAGYALAF